MTRRQLAVVILAALALWALLLAAVAGLCALGLDVVGAVVVLLASAAITAQVALLVRDERARRRDGGR